MCSVSDNEHRRAVGRFYLYFVLFVSSVLYVVEFLVRGPFAYQSKLILLLVVVCVVAVVYAQQTAKVSNAAFGIILYLYVVALLLSGSESAQTRGIYVCLAAAPMLAVLVLGIFRGFFCQILSCVVASCLMYPDLIAEQNELAIIDYTCCMIGMVALFSVAFAFEISRLRAAHDAALALQASQAANAARAEFLSTMSHEIRTPMNGILGLSQLLLEELSDFQHKKLARTIVNCSDTLLNILNDILDLSKLEAGKIEFEDIEFKLKELVLETADIFITRATEKNIQLTTHFSSSTPDWVRGDPTRLRQVLGNYISNALKFTDKGSVRIEAHGVDHGIELAVVDTGIGLAEDKIDKIFDSFTQADASTTRKYGGTGLGLTIVQRLVIGMGGRIDVKSKLGEGSRFSCWVPFAKAEPHDSDSTENHTTMDLGLKVLLVEDNVVNQMVMRQLLSKYLCDVTVAQNGEEAVSKALSEHWDVILMDCQMPVMDGYEATRRIRAAQTIYSEVPIIAMTANALQGDRERCLSCGMTDYLTKPVRKALLTRKLKNYVTL